MRCFFTSVSTDSVPCVTPCQSGCWHIRLQRKISLGRHDGSGTGASPGRERNGGMETTLSDTILRWVTNFTGLDLLDDDHSGTTTRDAQTTGDTGTYDAQMSCDEADAAVVAPADPTNAPDLGSISAKYESGAKGSNAIGNDTTGGWSYGKYQIATKTGTMKQFLDYVKTANPDLSKALEDAGGDKGATDHTDKFVAAWNKAASDGTLSPLEHGFIKGTHFDKQEETLKADGLDLAKRDKALSDVVWSVSVQHGPDTGLVTKALKKLVDAEKAKDKAAKTTRTDEEIVASIDDKDIIDAIYDERGATKEVKQADGTTKTVLKYFSGSTDAGQKSVADRFKSERKAAQAELKADRDAAGSTGGSPATGTQAPTTSGPTAPAPPPGGSST